MGHNFIIKTSASIVKHSNVYGLSVSCFNLDVEGPVKKHNVPRNYSSTGNKDSQSVREKFSCGNQVSHYFKKLTLHCSHAHLKYLRKWDDKQILVCM